MVTFYIDIMRYLASLLLVLLFTACQTASPIAVDSATTAAIPTSLPAATATLSPSSTLAPVVSETEVNQAATVEPVIVQTAALANKITLHKVSEGFNLPVFVTHAGDERILVVEKHGVVSIVLGGSRQSELFLDIESRVNSDSNEQGLLGLALHPEFRNNQRLFVYYTDASEAVVISEFTASADLQSVDPESEQILLSVEQPFKNHNGGALVFGPDNYLYIGLGDGGAANDPLKAGQDRGTLLGSILRIDVDSAEPYGIPATNPFVNDDEAQDEIWAYGIRNAWRMSFDSETGDLFIGDVGQNEWEEISWQSANSAGGENYGWNAWEGSHCFTDACEALTDATMPIIEYNHSEGCSVTGGYVYRGTLSPALYGNYVYGDFCSGQIWGAVKTESGWQTRLLTNTGFFISSFGVDVNNELYVVDYSGIVYQISAE